LEDGKGEKGRSRRAEAEAEGKCEKDENEWIILNH
jgi:hypothetical protein